jgi:hypothetical protein
MISFIIIYYWLIEKITSFIRNFHFLNIKIKYYRNVYLNNICKMSKKLLWFKLYIDFHSRYFESYFNIFSFKISLLSKIHIIKK